MGKKTLVFILMLGFILPGMPCRVKDGEKTKMNSGDPKKIHATQDLVGFCQVVHPPGNFLVILERDRNRNQSILSVWQFVAGEWQRLKKIASEDMSINGLDGYAPGSSLFICTEVNADEAVHLVSSDLAAFIQTKPDRIPFQEIGKLNLTAEQRRRVNLPLSQQWNVTTLLPPEKWLFHPKFVRGQTRSPWVVANTADGQTMIFSPDKGSRELEEFSIPNALEPQACILRGKRHVVFKGTEKPVYPFWASQGPNPVKAPLKVVVDQGTTTDLSAALGIGPVLGFALAPASEDDLWIFALREAVLGTNVVAIKKGSQGWTLQGERSLEGDVERLSAERGEGVFHLVYASRKPEGEGWSLGYESWPIPR